MSKPAHTHVCTHARTQEHTYARTRSEYYQATNQAEHEVELANAPLSQDHDAPGELQFGHWVQHQHQKVSDGQRGQVDGGAVHTSGTALAPHQGR